MNNGKQKEVVMVIKPAPPYLALPVAHNQRETQTMDERRADLKQRIKSANRGLLFAMLLGGASLFLLGVLFGNWLATSMRWYTALSIGVYAALLMIAVLYRYWPESQIKIRR